VPDGDHSIVVALVTEATAATAESYVRSVLIRSGLGTQVQVEGADLVE
jgi:hypothetical protein